MFEPTKIQIVTATRSKLITNSLLKILNISATCGARYPNLGEQKKHTLQWYESSVKGLLTKNDTLADCYRITLALLAFANVHDIDMFYPGRYPGLIPFLYPKYNDQVERGAVCYIENTLLSGYINIVNKFYSSGIGWWVISLGSGAEMSLEEIEYYTYDNKHVDREAQYVLAFIGSNGVNRPIQIIDLKDLIVLMISNGDKRLDQSDIIADQKQEYLEKRLSGLNNVTIKVQGNILTYKPENTLEYTTKLSAKYQSIRSELQEDIRNMTTEYLNFLRIYTEGDKMGAYEYLKCNYI
jgi:hypothetical protein